MFGRFGRPFGAGMTLALLAWLLVGCVPGSSPPPASLPTLPPTPGSSEHRLPSPEIGSSARELLATLPETAGGQTFDGVQVVDDSLNVFLPVDDVLGALGKERRDAVSVSRYSDSDVAEISATRVEGIGGGALLKAFFDTWDAPAVVGRSMRVVAVSVTAWELEERGGTVTVIYRLGDVVYLVSTQDRDRLEAILRDMPMRGP